MRFLSRSSKNFKYRVLIVSDRMHNIAWLMAPLILDNATSPLFAPYIANNKSPVRTSFADDSAIPLADKNSLVVVLSISAERMNGIAPLYNFASVEAGVPPEKKTHSLQSCLFSHSSLKPGKRSFGTDLPCPSREPLEDTNSGYVALHCLDQGDPLRALRLCARNPISASEVQFRVYSVARALVPVQKKEKYT